MPSSKIVPLITLGLILFIVTGTMESRQERENSAEIRLRELARSLTTGSVSKVEVLEMPPEIETRVAITPEMMQKQFYCKLEFVQERGSPLLLKLAAAMKDASANPQAKRADLRWGVLFYSDEGKRLGAIYFDARGSHGYVDGTPVEFGGELLQWANGAFLNWH